MGGRRAVHLNQHAGWLRCVGDVFCCRISRGRLAVGSGPIGAAPQRGIGRYGGRLSSAWLVGR